MTTPWEFLGGPVVKTLPSNAGIAGLTPGQGARIPHASLPKSQSIKEKIFLGSKITEDSDCSQEIKRHFLHERKAVTNLEYSKAETSLC